MDIIKMEYDIHPFRTHLPFANSYTYIKTAQIKTLFYLCVTIPVKRIVKAFFDLLIHPEISLNYNRAVVRTLPFGALPEGPSSIIIHFLI